MNRSPLLHLRTPHTLQDLDDSHGTALSASWTARNGKPIQTGLFALNLATVSCCRRRASTAPSFLCHPRLPINQNHVGGLDTYLGPAVGLLGVQQTAAQGQADGKRCNPTAESRRGAPRPDGPLPVTARRKQPHPIPAMASNPSLDGARSTVPRYSAMAAWRTSPRRDPAIERELDRKSGGHDSAPARRRCRFGIGRDAAGQFGVGRDGRGSPFLAASSPKRKVKPGELACKSRVVGGARVLPVDEEETMSAFCRKPAVAEHWQPTAGVLCRITGGHDTGRADFAVRLEAKRGMHKVWFLPLDPKFPGSSMDP